jgi:5-methylcytosine-specific restriction endonuclease McrA
VIRPKTARPSKADEATAYELATIRDLNTCQRCRRDCGSIARDHRVNRSQGGETVASNLQLLGLGCHSWATEHPQDATAEGWAAPGYAEPSVWPARRWLPSQYGLRLAWVTYDDAGGVTEITEGDRLVRMGLVQDMTEDAF